MSVIGEKYKVAYVALAWAPGLAGSTSPGSADAQAGPRHSGATAAVWIHEAVGSAWGLGARGTPSPLRGHDHCTFGPFVPPGAAKDPPRAPGPQAALTARATMGLRGHEGRTWDTSKTMKSLAGC